jgi:hypothetical protein
MIINTVLQEYDSPNNDSLLFRLPSLSPCSDILTYLQHLTLSSRLFSRVRAYSFVNNTKL